MQNLFNNIKTTVNGSQPLAVEMPTVGNRLAAGKQPVGVLPTIKKKVLRVLQVL